MNPTEALDRISKCVKSGPYNDDSWDSFEPYRIPQWYRDGKLGIFIHWGVYSVPAFSSEWYARNMYLKRDGEDSTVHDHHVKTYGPVDQFGYKDFIPRFKAGKFDPDEWATLFKESGARFVMPVAEHHDGFAMYETAWNRWNAAKMGPCRDVIHDLSVSVREQGLQFAVSSHREENCWFFNGGMEIPSDVQDDEFRDLYGPALAVYDEKDAGWVGETPDQKWLDDWLIRTCELVDRFQPAIVFFDWWIEEACYQKALLTFAAYYYNRCREWGFEGAINFKHEAMPPGAGVFDVERGQLAGIRPVFWQTDTSVAFNSWSYCEDMQYRSAASIIHDFIDIISKNGGLLLNVGPRADGTIPEEQKQLLRELGKWLAVNGEGVYGTRPWKIFGEGPTEVTEGMFAEKHRKDFGAHDIRFVTKAGKLYAHFLGWPGSNKLTIRSFRKDGKLCLWNVATVEMLGEDGTLNFERDEDGMHVELPSGDTASRHAWVLRLTPA